MGLCNSTADREADLLMMDMLGRFNLVADAMETVSNVEIFQILGPAFCKCR